MLHHFAAMKNTLVRHALFLLLAASLSAAQGQNARSLKTEYLDDFAETCKHLDQLSQAMPANKYGWRPGAGVRSVSEVYVHKVYPMRERPWWTHLFGRRPISFLSPRSKD